MSTSRPSHQSRTLPICGPICEPVCEPAAGASSWDEPRALVAAAGDALRGQDFLCTWDHDRVALTGIVAAARALENAYRNGRGTRLFEQGLAVSLFRDQSTRTRFAFASAANLLGLALQELDESKSQIAHGETVRETANMMSFCARCIGIRDDIFVHEGHRAMREIAAAVSEGAAASILPFRPTVINLQSDLDHPTQAMADLCHLAANFGGLDALRGKKIAVSWAYSPSYGKPLSVPQGLIGLLPRFGAHVVLAHPPGYELLDEALAAAHKAATRDVLGGFEVTHSMRAAFADADVVYPKSWAPLRLLEQRTQALRQGDKNALDRLARQFLDSNAAHLDWTCDAALMETTRGGKALYMHCLPADIAGVSCERGEVSQPVFERYRLCTYRQAAYKPFVISAMIMLTCAADAGAYIDRLRPADTER